MCKLCHGGASRLGWGGRRIDVVEMIDQWYGADYRYVKIKGSDGGIYILRFDEIRDEWALIMSSPRGARR